MYNVVASISVDDEGIVTTIGDEIDVITEVAIADRTRSAGRLTFVDDPVAWIRNAHKAFRTPYLVSVVTQDTEARVPNSASRTLV